RSNGHRRNRRHFAGRRCRATKQPAPDGKGEKRRTGLTARGSGRRPARLRLASNRASASARGASRRRDEWRPRFQRRVERPSVTPDQILANPAQLLVVLVVTQLHPAVLLPQDFIDFSSLHLDQRGLLTARSATHV